jgi:hypothetical protein
LPSASGYIASFENPALSGKIVLTKNGRIGIRNNSPSFGIDICTAAGGGDPCKIRAESLVTFSDRREKTNITEISEATSIIDRLHPVYFNWKKTNTGPDGKLIFSDEALPEPTVGLVAQEVYSVFPMAVEKPADETTQAWSISYEKFIPLLVKSVQELSAQNSTLARRLEALEGKRNK